MGNTGINGLGAGSSSQSRVGFWVLLLIVFALDVVFMPRTVCHNDAGQWREETLAILEHGRLWVEPEDAASRYANLEEHFVYNESDGRLYSQFGVVNSLMALPPMAIERFLTGHTSAETPNILLTNGWNILLSLLAAGVLYATTGRYCGRTWLRVVYVLACFFSTYVWYYQRAQSGEIYQLLFFVLLYECLLRGVVDPNRRSTWWILLAWVFIGLLVLTRIFFGVLLFMPFGAYLVSIVFDRRSARRALPALLIPPFLIVVILGWVNNVKFGSPFLSGYHQYRPEDHQFIGNAGEGIYGLLFSTHWSIFLYFPLLLMAIFGVPRFARAHRVDAAVLLGTFVVTMLVLAKIPTWRGEWTYGPRYMTFILPTLGLPCLYMAEDWCARRSGAVWLAIVAVMGGIVISTYMQFVVIRNGFWCFYEIEHPLDNRMDRDLAEYLLDNHESMIIRDLESHRDNLDDTQLFHIIVRDSSLTPQQLVLYRKMIADNLDSTNLYWWPPRPMPEAMVP
jgi:hypothetical protein